MFLKILCFLCRKGRVELDKKMKESAIKHPKWKIISEHQKTQQKRCVETCKSAIMKTLKDFGT